MGVCSWGGGGSSKGIIQGLGWRELQRGNNSLCSSSGERLLGDTCAEK